MRIIFSTIGTATQLSNVAPIVYMKMKSLLMENLLVKNAEKKTCFHVQPVRSATLDIGIYLVVIKMDRNYATLSRKE